MQPVRSSAPRAHGRCYATHIAAALIALSWALGASGEPAPDSEQAVTVSLSGDRIESSENYTRFRAVGNAQACHPDVAISADTLWVDTEMKIAAASGEVRVTTENGVLTGDEFVYCLDSGTAFLTNASAALTTQTKTGDVTAYFAGRELQYDGETARILDGSFTTCSANHPHYAIKAKELKLSPGGTLVATGAHVALYRMRLPSLPTIRINLGESDDTSSLAPAVGLSGRDGLYASLSLELTGKGTRPQVKAEGRLSARELFRGRIYGAFVDNERQSLTAVIGLNEDVGDEITRNLVVDRLPEVAAASEWSLGSGGRSAWYADVAVGNYRESPGKAEAWRESAEVGARHSFPLGDRAQAEVDLSFRQSFYSSGDSLGVAAVQAGVTGMIGRRFSGGARYIGRFTDGRSPFEFDDIDIEQELFTRFVWRFGEWGILAATRYDIDRGEFRRARLGVNKIVHCIQYGVTYDTVLREVGLRVALPGL